MIVDWSVSVSIIETRGIRLLQGGGVCNQYVCAYLGTQKWSSKIHTQASSSLFGQTATFSISAPFPPCENVGKYSRRSGAGPARHTETAITRMETALSRVGSALNFNGSDVIPTEAGLETAGRRLETGKRRRGRAHKYVNLSGTEAEGDRLPCSYDLYAQLLCVQVWHSHNYTHFPTTLIGTVALSLGYIRNMAGHALLPTWLKLISPTHPFQDVVSLTSVCFACTRCVYIGWCMYAWHTACMHPY